MWRAGAQILGPFVTQSAIYLTIRILSPPTSAWLQCRRRFARCPTAVARARGAPVVRHGDPAEDALGLRRFLAACAV